MKNRIPRPLPNIGTAWVGKWYNNRVGWFGCSHLIRNSPAADIVAGVRVNAPAGTRAYLCDVTMTPRFDKRGRPITRIVRKPDAKEARP